MTAEFKTRPLAITDLETTGTDHEIHEIIELGVYIVNQQSLDVLDTLELKIKPQHIETASPAALKKNGYTEEGWHDAIGLKEAMEAYAGMAKGTMIASWNDSFEYRFLRKAFYDTGLGDPDNIMDYHKRDIASLAAEVLRNSSLERENKDFVAEFLGIEPEPEVHRAINGVEHAYQIYKKLRELIDDRLDNSVFGAN